MELGQLLERQFAVLQVQEFAAIGVGISLGFQIFQNDYVSGILSAQNASINWRLLSNIFWIKIDIVSYLGPNWTGSPTFLYKSSKAGIMVSYIWISFGKTLIISVKSPPAPLSGLTFTT